jgi:uncharacterized protein
MQLEPNPNDGTNIFTGYENDHVVINGKPYRGNLIVLPQRILSGWTNKRIDELTADDLAPLADLGAQTVLLGAGITQPLLHPRLSKPLTDKGIALEVMTFQAACRTYNVLAGERRSVVCVLLLD